MAFTTKPFLLAIVAAVAIDVACATATAANNYRHADGVGGHGGTCTCPDGKVYSVGDNNDNAARLLASLAWPARAAPTTRAAVA